MWDYTRDSKKFYYANYPYNDLRLDPYISNDPNTYDTPDSNYKPYRNQFRKSGRYTFHSPDIHFTNPKLGTELKLETEEYGESEGYFNEAQEQAKFKFVSTFGYTLAIAAGVAAAFSAEKEKECKTVTIKGIQNVAGTVPGPIFTFPGFPGVNISPVAALSPNDAFLYDDNTGLPTSLGSLTNLMNPLAVTESSRTTCRGTTYQLLNPASLNPAGFLAMQIPYLIAMGLFEMQK